MKRGFTNEAIAEVAEKCHFNMASVGRHFGVSRVSVWKRVHGDPKLLAMFSEGVETNLDVAEDRLFNLIEEGNVAATIFYLKTQGKRRGYIERTETSGPNGGPVKSETRLVFGYDDGDDDE